MDANGPPAPWLVVVADDGGIDVARNCGILHAWKHGLVRCTSVIATGEGFDHLAEAVRRERKDGAPLPVGLHLNLTEGTAMTGPRPGLTDAAGRFLEGKHDLWRRALAGGIDADVVQREAEAQLARLEDAGLVPGHVDGHQHVHLLPGVREGLAAALRSFPSVRWVRAPREAGPSAAASPGGSWPRIPREQLCADAMALHDQGDRAAAAVFTLVRQAQVLLEGDRRAADALVGLGLVGAFEQDALLAQLTQSAGLGSTARGAPVVVEWMTHPGECDPASVAFSECEQREHERDALCDAGLAREIADLGFRVGSFADVEAAA